MLEAPRASIWFGAVLHGRVVVGRRCGAKIGAGALVAAGAAPAKAAPHKSSNPA